MLKLMKSKKEDHKNIAIEQTNEGDLDVSYFWRVANQNI